MARSGVANIFKLLETVLFRSSVRTIQLSRSNKLVNPVSVVHIINCGREQGDHDENKEQLNLKYASFCLASIAGAFCLGDRNGGTDEDDSRLFQYCKVGNILGVQRLVKEGIDINTAHYLGWSAIHVAVVNERMEVVKKLLELGANPDTPDNFSDVLSTAEEKKVHPFEVVMKRDEYFSGKLNDDAIFKGFTALHYATLLGYISIVKVLLEAGADPTIENAVGHTPYAYARNATTKKMLQEFSEKFLEKKKALEVEERRKYPLENKLKDHIIGQEGPIKIVSSTIRRKQNGWMNEDHPLVMLFLGSSGIGKTELAKQLAYYLNKGKPGGFIRFDMSEYQEKHEAAKLIGAPPGYIGHNEGGQLTRKLKESPNAVVLFDEVDKAHPDVLTVLLQLFDEGRLTDSKGNTISCKNAIFVMTSNLASDEIAHHAMELRKQNEQKLDKDRKLEGDDVIIPDEKITLSKKFKEEVIFPILKHHFKRYEFLGRINEIIFFLPFTRSELHRLVLKELQFWAKKAKDNHNVELSWEQDVETLIADGYIIQFGARSLQYEIERRIVNQIAAAHERGIVKRNSSIHVSVEWLPDKKGGRKVGIVKLKIRLPDEDKYITFLEDSSLFVSGLYL